MNILSIIKAIEGLNKGKWNICDVTGGAGHSKEIVNRLTDGKLIGINQDLNLKSKRGVKSKYKTILVHSYVNIDKVLSN